MATTAIMSPSVLSGFEDAAGDFDGLGAVVRAVIDALGPEGGAEVHRLLQAAVFMHETIDAKFAAVIEQGYAERRQADAA